MAEKVKDCDLLVGAVLSTGAKAPVLVSRELIGQMKPGAVIVDVAVDQGGCVETCKPTTHAEPVFIIDHVLHYCVANMPGAVGRTSTYALSNATLPYALDLANKGYRQAALESKEIAQSLGVSLRTVETHRNFIRKKLGISGHDVNLTTFLRTLK